jgi:hypothetical protein
VTIDASLANKKRLWRLHYLRAVQGINFSKCCVNLIRRTRHAPHNREKLYMSFFRWSWTNSIILPDFACIQDTGGVHAAVLALRKSYGLKFCYACTQAKKLLAVLSEGRSKAEPSKLSGDNLIQILNQAKPEEWQSIILGASIELYKFNFQGTVTVLRNAKSDRHLKRNVVWSKRPTIPSLRKRAIGTSPKTKSQYPNHSQLRTQNVRTAVAQIMRQKTVGLALKTKGSPDPVRKMSVLLTRMS